MNGSVHDFKAISIKGAEMALSQYEGKVLLVVNIASKCGFTPQYEGLEALYGKYKGQGFEILGFPCNQFAHQEPGTGAEIEEFCRINHGVTFPLFAKIDVNGKDAHPLFSFLQKALPGILGIPEIKWNFTKFLIDREGKPVKRFSPDTEPSDIGKDVEALLAR